MDMKMQLEHTRASESEHIPANTNKYKKQMSSRKTTLKMETAGTPKQKQHDKQGLSCRETRKVPKFTEAETKTTR